ncbi:glycine cleavage system aminomethyltransferase GcvT [Microbacterium sp. ET2]|uniref:glycine cleavage system aminomethyltransferase GcvT n=1 Tax=Microbacterium albipurpureum TaxID=3050384 RepID=UPI00259C7481|nr:glycine cleavage system aminomethyltransferase GcvT [Microbacterium sp. ET2 (Ac-2212)]WJL95957.1 glycine cleavage system aminomethyltransferase GcvT [Microbacterium sp. ET2 (Ac-2212)]
MDSTARQSPLHDRHAQLGASFTDFGGWLMPVRYTSDLAEHHAVRSAAGLFDISHMAEFWVHDGRAADFLDYVLAGRVSTLEIGKAKYSLVLAEDGGIIDDVIVYRTGEQYFLVVANAGNRDAVAEALAAARTAWPRILPFLDGPVEGDWSGVAGSEVPRVEDLTEQTALIAVQGPRAREVLEALPDLDLSEPAPRAGEPRAPWELADLSYYAARAARWRDADLLVARTGYTGEDGFELLAPAGVAGELWDALLVAGEPFGLVPAGLAARDTLRLEAGMPLYGHELGRGIRPAQAGLGRVVAADKADFVGKNAVADEGAPVLVGLVSEGRRAGRAGYGVFAGDGRVGRDRVGEVTSGALSPTLGHPIAMAYVSPAASALGTELAIDVRGTRIPATVTALPFYRRKK